MIACDRRGEGAVMIPSEFGSLWRLATVVIGIVATLLATPAFAQGKPKIRIAHGGQVLNISYPWLEMPAALKYWDQEGYDVEVFIGQSSLQSIQLLVAGQADLAQINSGPLVQAVTKNGIPVQDVMMNTVIEWSLVVPEDSPITSVKGFKGKSIGTSSLGTGGVALLKSFMEANGINPDKDIEILPVGIGPLAYEALRTDKVQGLMYWGSAIASFENFGAKFRRFYDPNWRKLPDFSLVALKSTVDRDPKAIEAVVRGAAKGSLFALTNPDCARKVQWAYRPASKPSGADEATLIKNDVHYLGATLDAMKLALDLSGGKEWGKTTPAQFDPLQEFLLRTKQIDKKVPSADLVVGIPNFFERANNFDHEAVEKQAIACNIKM
jgi:NitT/TauT family transport system substrate-binding protein